MTARSCAFTILVCASAVLSTGCNSPSESVPPGGGSRASSIFPSKKIDASPPYIVQEDCKFFLVTAAGTVSTTSERNSGLSGNATLNMGGHRMVLSDCTLAENPGKLPVF